MAGKIEDRIARERHHDVAYIFRLGEGRDPGRLGGFGLVPFSFFVSDLLTSPTGQGLGTNLKSAAPLLTIGRTGALKS